MQHRMLRAIAPLLATCYLFASLPLTSAETGVRDTPFDQQYRDLFPMPDAPGANDVRGVAVDSDDRVWIATHAGVFYLDGDRWKEPEGDSINGPCYDIVAAHDGPVWIAAWNGVYRSIYQTTLSHATGLDVPIAAVHDEGESIIAGGPDGIWKYQNGGWQELRGDWATSINDLATLGEELWVATGVGMYRVHEGRTQRFYQEDEIASADVRALAVDPEESRLWVGTSAGLDLFVDGKRKQTFTGHEGLPCSDVHSLSIDPRGALWIGTSLGLVSHTNDAWSLRHGPRWLPHDHARGAAWSDDGTTWVATAAGVSALRTRKVILAEKAQHYEELLRQRHVRPPGLVERCDLARPGDVTSYKPVDTDNDGMYTAMYVAAEAYRYAVTRSEEAKANAIASFRALEFLQTVTETPGFIARTVIPSDWTQMADVNRSYTPQEAADEHLRDPRWKQVERRWRLSQDGRWLWKGDTSSDEISGHFYVFGVYYDLIAEEDAAEKARVEAHVKRVMDGIIANGFTLVDIDGKPTRWGVWSPEKLNDDPNWRLDRGVNSVEILSFLKVAWHITGDDAYEQAAKRLLDDHQYRRNVLDPQTSDPAGFTHIDSQLLAMAYRGLLAYETDPARRELYLESLRRWFAINRRDHSPFYNFVYGAIVGDDFDLADCVDYLRDVPWQMVDWTVDNRAREDVRLVRRPAASHWQVDRLLPPSERAVMKWDSNPYSAIQGNGGTSENCAVYWLLPYWMGRYHGFVVGPILR